MSAVLRIDPEAPGRTISARRWRREFEGRAGRHRDRVVERPVLDNATEAALRSSLAVFQLGETGDGAHLLGLTERLGDPDLHAAMALFVAEEQEHARLLADVLHQFDEPLLTRHWTDGVFQASRRISGLRAEVLTLLVAELIALRYYSALADGLSEHDELSTLFAAIHADEIRHVDFHADTLPALLDRWPRLVWWSARVLWNVVLYGSSLVVAWGHRHILRRCGLGVWGFLVDTHHIIRRYEPRFFRRR